MERVEVEVIESPTRQVSKTKTAFPPEPNPYNFRIIKTQTGPNQSYTLAMVVYSDCTNYEGKKVLLLQMRHDKLMTLKKLDPHFFDNGENGLLARFEPTDRGWRMGVAALNALQPR